MDVGLDFGSTNSIVSFWDKEKKSLEIFRLDNQEYIPSLVSFEVKDNSLSNIGNYAFQDKDRNPDRYHIERLFKIDLSQNKSLDSERIKSAEEIAFDFISELLTKNGDSFEKRKGAISNLVVSVPELWHNRISNNGIEKLESIISKCDLPLKQLISEPVAAAAYFMFKYNLGKDKEETALVFDMGGGTLDVSLCRLSNGSIDVIAFEGNDNNAAGAHHIKNIAKNALKRNNQEYDSENIEHQRFSWKLEKFLINKKTSQTLREFYQECGSDLESNDCELEKIDGIAIWVSDVFNAFQDIHDGIQVVISRLGNKVPNLHSSFDHILLTGGFSQYFMVRETILDYFKLKAEDPKVKASNHEESYLSISFGAALIAANKITIKERYPHSVFITCKDENDIDYNLKIIEANKARTDTSTYGHHKVRIHENIFKLKGMVHIEGDTSLSKPFTRDLSISSERFKKGEFYKVGIKINKSNSAKIILNNLNNEVIAEEPLGNLI